ncbi:MAG: hypothetical protein ACREDK_05935 [Thermoplasmata archaeon]
MSRSAYFATFALGAIMLGGVLPVPAAAAGILAASPIRPLAPNPAGSPAVLGPQISATISPTMVCAGGGSNCSASQGVARVTLASQLGLINNFSSYQVAFVVDTTPYSGVYDATAGEPGSDHCAATPGSYSCEESDGAPLLIHNSSKIAAAI